MDLTAIGVSMTTTARAADYVNDHGPQDGMISPVFADFSGFPPLLIQVGGNEVLLDDSPRLATRAAANGASRSPCK